MSAQAVEIIPINGPDNPSHQYVEVGFDRGREIVMLRRAADEAQLPIMWPRWAQHLILGPMTGSKSMFRVDVRGKRVYVSSARGFDKALAATVLAAGQLQPLPNPPLVRLDHRDVERFSACWMSTDQPTGQWLWYEPHWDVVLRRSYVWQIVQDIQLTRGYRLFFNEVKAHNSPNYYLEIILRRTKQTPFSVAHAAANFELQYRLAYAKLQALEPAA